MVVRSVNSARSSSITARRSSSGGAAGYVTGSHGAMRHLGNATVRDVEKPESMITADTLNLKSVEGHFDTSGYPSAQSDIVALMVFEHQMHVVNLLVRVGWDARVAQFAQNLDVTAGPLRDAIDELVDYFLFVDEAPLTAKVTGRAGLPKDSARPVRATVAAGLCASWT